MTSQPAPDLHQRNDGRDWARAIMAQFERGEKRPPTVYRFAHEALGLPVPKGLK